MFFVERRFRAVGSVGRKECSVKCEVWRKQWEVKSVKCGVWSVECEVSVWSAKSAVWSVKCEVWSVKEAVRSEKCEVWSVKFEVWSVKCGVWSVKTLLRLSLKKSNGCRGKDTVGTGCLWTTFMFGKLPPPACPGLCYLIIHYKQSILGDPQFVEIQIIFVF